MLVMVGLAAHDASEGDEPVMAGRAAEGDADRLGQLEGAGHVEYFEAGAGTFQDTRGALGETIHHLAVIRRADDEEVRRRALECHGLGGGRVLGAHSAGASVIGS